MNGLFLVLGFIVTILLGGAAFVTIMLHRAEKADKAEQSRRA